MAPFYQIKMFRITQSQSQSHNIISASDLKLVKCHVPIRAYLLLYIRASEEEINFKDLSNAFPHEKIYSCGFQYSVVHKIVVIQKYLFGLKAV